MDNVKISFLLMISILIIPNTLAINTNERIITPPTIVDVSMKGITDTNGKNIISVYANITKILSNYFDYAIFSFYDENNTLVTRATVDNDYIQYSKYGNFQVNITMLPSYPKTLYLGVISVGGYKTNYYAWTLLAGRDYNVMSVTFNDHIISNKFLVDPVVNYLNFSSSEISAGDDYKIYLNFTDRSELGSKNPEVQIIDKNNYEVIDTVGLFWDESINLYIRGMTSNKLYPTNITITKVIALHKSYSFTNKITKEITISGPVMSINNTLPRSSPKVNAIWFENKEMNYDDINTVYLNMTTEGFIGDVSRVYVYLTDKLVKRNSDIEILLSFNESSGIFYNEFSSDKYYTNSQFISSILYIGIISQYRYYDSLNYTSPELVVHSEFTETKINFDPKNVSVTTTKINYNENFTVYIEMDNIGLLQVFTISETKVVGFASYLSYDMVSGRYITNIDALGFIYALDFPTEIKLSFLFYSNSHLTSLFHTNDTINISVYYPDSWTAGKDNMNNTISSTSKIISTTQKDTTNNTSTDNSLPISFFWIISSVMVINVILRKKSTHII